MIGSPKNNRENYPRKCFWTHEKETRVKFNPELIANRPSNNWALNENKPKTSFKKWIRTVLYFIDLIQFLLIWQMLAKFFGVEYERAVSKFRKRKRKCLCCVHLLHKQGAWNLEVSRHVVVVKWRLRNVQKSVMHVQKSLFSFLLFSCYRRRYLSPLNFATMVTWRNTFFLY